MFSQWKSLPEGLWRLLRELWKTACKHMSVARGGAKHLETSRMKAVAGRDFSRVLEREGWHLLHISRNHHIYGKQDSNVRLSVLVQGNQPLKIGLLTHLLKSAGLTEEDI
jgi:predicted RNA binding protein YcfA (HicA-like mRNA interferase family)